MTTLTILQVLNKKLRYGNPIIDRSYTYPAGLMKNRTIWGNINTYIISSVGNKAKGRISKRVFQESKARQIFQKTNIWFALFSWNTRFEICLFALLLMNVGFFFAVPQTMAIPWERKIRENICSYSAEKLFGKFLGKGNYFGKNAFSLIELYISKKLSHARIIHPDLFQSFVPNIIQKVFGSLLQSRCDFR